MKTPAHVKRHFREELVVFFQQPFEKDGTVAYTVGKMVDENHFRGQAYTQIYFPAITYR